MIDCKEQILQTIEGMCQDHLVLGTWGNVSVREGDTFWITPSGMPYDVLQAVDLIQIDLRTKKASGLWKPSSEWQLHAAIYQQRADCGAIVHTHSTYATAFAVAHVPIPPVVEDLVQIVGGGVDVAEYALPGSEELAVNAVLALGTKNAVLLANHGLIGTAKTIAEALTICRIVEKTAHVTVMARTLGSVPELSQDDVKKMRDFYLTSYGPGLKGERSQ